MAILEAKGLTKTFGPKVAVNGINLHTSWRLSLDAAPKSLCGC